MRAQKYSSACKNEKDVLRKNQPGVERSFYKINKGRTLKPRCRKKVLYFAIGQRYLTTWWHLQHISTSIIIMRYGNYAVAGQLQITCKFNFEFGGTNEPIQKFHTKKSLVSPRPFSVSGPPRYHTTHQTNNILLNSPMLQS